ncbi:MAG: acylase [Gemmatimonadota bacterium]
MSDVDETAPWDSFRLLLRRPPSSVTLALALLAAAVVFACRSASHPRLDGSTPAPASEPAEILWDTWGIPHIHAPDAEALFHAFGWAQARSHGDLLLRLYGQDRCRAAEYWGEDHLDRDRWCLTLGIRQEGSPSYAAQSPKIRRYLDAFAAGIELYAREHPESIADEVEAVLPVSGEDVMRHVAALGFFFSPAREIAERWAAGDGTAGGSRSGGSNAWAIAPSRSESGHALLLADPHLSWGGPATWFEAQLVAPGIDAYGATLVGLPLLAIAFNDRLGWTHTVNTQDTEDHYELDLVEGSYRWNAGVHPFVADTQQLLVRRADGSLREERFVRRLSVHGPVIATRDGEALALRAFSTPAGVLQWWEMARARNLEEFERALGRQAIVGQNVVYADADGNILFAYGAATPRRPGRDYSFWSGIVPGDTSAFLWEGAIPYEASPRVLNPPSGWVQNTNDPPWFSTWPPVLDPARFPAFTAPRGFGLRTQRSIGMLREAGSIGFDELIRLKHSTRSPLADRILPELLDAAAVAGSGLETASLAEAARVLASWDRETDADSRGAVLFKAWYDELRRRSEEGVFAEPWSAEDPLRTPDGLPDPALARAALVEAADSVKNRWGALDVPWGEVHRLRRDTVDLPANGAVDLGVFRVAWYRDGEDGKRVAAGGDSYVAVIEFGDPVRARALVPYGNASQPGSLHRADQLAFFARKELRPVWRSRAEVEAHLEERTVLPAVDARPAAQPFGVSGAIPSRSAVIALPTVPGLGRRCRSRRRHRGSSATAAGGP